MDNLFITAKNGIKAVRRTPVKTALFLILLIIATIFMSIGVGLYSAAYNMLKQADEMFITTAEFTFTGGYYPSEKFYDPFLHEIQESFSVKDLVNVKGAVHAEENIRLRATIDDYPNSKSVMPYQEENVFIAKVTSLRGTHLTTNAKYENYAIIEEMLYTYKEQGGYHIYLDSALDEGLKYEEGHYYIFTGSFTYGYNSKTFYPKSYSYIFKNNEEYPYMVDITEYYPDNMDKFWATDIGTAFKNAVDFMQTVNNAVDVIVTENSEALEAFHRGENTFVRGGVFTSEDYEAGNKCIIFQGISSKTKASLGDMLTLKIHNPSTGGSIIDSYVPGEGFAATEEFEVVGVYQSETYEPYIYITYSGQPWAERSKSDYSLGRIILENSKRRDFESYVRANDLLPSEIHMSIYDQGYEEAVMPILGMMETSQFIIIVCSLFSLLLILFFGFFFVYRNGQTVTTLMNLGTGYGKTLAFLLTGCAVISIISSIIGSVIGFLFSESVGQKVFAAAQDTLDFDLRFSLRGMGLKAEIFAPIIKLNPLVYIGVALILFGITVLICGIFSFETIRKENPMYKFKYKFKQQSKKDSKKIKKKGLPKLIFVDYLPLSSLRYSVKSLIRGNSRSAVIPIVFLCITIFINVFFTIKSNFENQLETVYDDIPVIMQTTDFRGRMYDNVVTPAGVLQSMLQNNQVSDFWFTQKLSYDYNGRILHADGTPDETPLTQTKVVFQRSGEYELFLEGFDKNFEKLIWTNDIAHAPEFYYNKGELEINYGAGLSENDLTPPVSTRGYQTDTGFVTVEVVEEKNPDPTKPKKTYMRPVGVIYEDESEESAESQEPEIYWFTRAVGYVSTNFLEKHDLEVGDTIALTMLNFTEYISARDLEFKILGTFKKQAARENIYMYVELSSIKTSFSTGYRLTDTRNISEFKNWLARNYDEVGTIGPYRRWITVDDMPLYRAIQSIERYINYLNITYPLILLLILCTGFFVANTLMKGRLWEIAVMQGVGNRRISIFFSFMIEQILLSIPGVLGGLLISLFASFILINIQNVFVFIICYFVGAGLAIMQAQSVTAIKSLKDKED